MQTGWFYMRGGETKWSIEEMRLNNLKRGVPFVSRNSYFESVPKMLGGVEKCLSSFLVMSSN